MKPLEDFDCERKEHLFLVLTAMWNIDKEGESGIRISGRRQF